MTPVEQITSLYIGYFGRAPDPEGLNYWVGRLADGFSLAEISESFSVQPESTTKYPYLANPNIASPDAFIMQVYMNLFNRAPDAEGLAYWRGELLSGADVGQFILNVISGAVTAPDSTIVENKIEVGVDFALEASNQPGFSYDDGAAAAAAAVIDGVDETEASVEAGKAESDAYFAGGIVGEIVALTESVDTLIGGTNNDTFVGLIDTASDTFTVADDINGGGGTDTLRLTTTGDAANAIDLSIADIASIEQLELRIADVNFTAVNLNDEDGVFETVTLDFRGGSQNNNVSVDNGNSNTAIVVQDVDLNGSGLGINFAENSDIIDASLTLQDVNDAFIEINFDPDADGTTDDDAITISLDNVSNTDLDFGDMETVNISVLSDSQLNDVDIYYTESGDSFGPQTINIDLAADLSIESLDTNDDDDATFNITGAGNLEIVGWGSVDSNLTFNAEDATGNINIAEINDDAESVTAELGSGDDRLTFEEGFDFSNLTADGNGGANILGADADDITSVADAELSGFETLEITGAAAAAVVVDADDNGFENVILGVDVGSDLTIEDLSGDLAIQADQTGNVTVTPEGASDDLDVSLDLEGDTIDIASLDLSDYTDVNFVSQGTGGDATDADFASLAVNNVDTLTFNGEGDVTITTLLATDLETLDLTGLTGQFDASGSALGDETSVLVGNLDGTSTVALGAGAGTNLVTFGEDLDNTFQLENFAADVGGDVLDLGALGVDSFADLNIVLNGADTVITSDAFEGEIVLIGVAPADLDGTANFAF